jgi:tRNA nucleotidyltransferase (CCA-adding enzyme)
LLVDGLPMLDRVSGERIRSEIELILRESDPVPIVERLQQLGVLQQLHPSLVWSQEAATTFENLQRLMQHALWQEALQGQTPASVYFALWMANQAGVARRAMLERLHVRKSTREEVEGLVHLVQILNSFDARVKPSEVERQLRPYGPRPRILLAARAFMQGHPAAELLEQYQAHWRHVRPALDGNDLREMQVSPGPQYGHLLDCLLAARLDGEVSSEGEERALLERLLKDLNDNHPD